MGINKFRRPVMTAGLVVSAVERKTSTGTLNAYGLSVIDSVGSTADKTFTLPLPTFAGQTKQIVVATTGAQKVTVTIGGATASGFIVGAGGNVAGTTFRSIVFSSKSTSQRLVGLIAASGSAWALVAKSTGVSFAG